jgi:signal peptidase I
MLQLVLRPQAASGAVLSAVLVMLTILLTPLPELFGWQLYAVETGSMEPAIPVGSVVAVRPVRADELHVGDVITFSDRTQPDIRVTHRIVALERNGDQQAATTKGDANNTTDSWSVPLNDNVARVEAHVPYAGYVMYWLGSPSVKLAALGLAAWLFLGPRMGGRKRSPKDDRGDRDEEPGEGPATSGDARGPSVDDLSREIEALLGSVKPSP